MTVIIISQHTLSIDKFKFRIDAIESIGLSEISDFEIVLKSGFIKQVHLDEKIHLSFEGSRHKIPVEHNIDLLIKLQYYWDEYLKDHTLDCTEFSNIMNHIAEQMEHL